LNVSSLNSVAEGGADSDLAHNLLRAAGTLAGQPHAVARGATLRHKIVNIPARNADLCCGFPTTGLEPPHGSRRGTTQIKFVTPDQVTYRPKLGVLYPSELAN
jgi:hypothetical protein